MEEVVRNGLAESASYKNVYSIFLKLTFVFNLQCIDYSKRHLKREELFARKRYGIFSCLKPCCDFKIENLEVNIIVV